MPTKETIDCPFCNAKNFNKLVLNIHLAMGRCSGYDTEPIKGDVACESITTPIDPPRPIGGHREC